MFVFCDFTTCMSCIHHVCVRLPPVGALAARVRENKRPILTAIGVEAVTNAVLAIGNARLYLDKDKLVRRVLSVYVRVCMWMRISALTLGSTEPLRCAIQRYMRAVPKRHSTGHDCPVQHLKRVIDNVWHFLACSPA